MSSASLNQMVAADAMPKSLFGYDVLDFIGEGAGSMIYAVSRPESGQIYALKHVVRKDEKRCKVCRAA